MAHFGRLHSSHARGALRIATGDGTSLSTNILMNDFAWDIPNLLPLWFRGDTRGNDVIIPGVEGVLAYRRRLTVTGYSLPLIVTGQVDLEGAATEPSDWWENLELNLAHLETQIVTPPGTISGTRLASLTLPSTDVRQAEIHVLGVTPGQATDGILLATLDISIPDGVFA